MIIEFVTNTHTDTHALRSVAPSVAFACLCLCTYIVYNTYITMQERIQHSPAVPEQIEDNSEKKSGRWDFQFIFSGDSNELWYFFPSNVICSNLFVLQISFELVPNLFRTLCIDTKGTRGPRTKFGSEISSNGKWEYFNGSNSYTFGWGFSFDWIHRMTWSHLKTVSRSWASEASLWRCNHSFEQCSIENCWISIIYSSLRWIKWMPFPEVTGSFSVNIMF